MTSYTDNIKVKISEKYKPPPRINLVVSYAQRLKLNKQIQDNIPTYNFSMENCVIKRMKEWKENKLLFFKQRQSKLELKRQKFEARKDLTKNVEVSQADSLCSVSYFAVSSGISEILRNDLSNINSDIPQSSILTPTQASTSYSTILKPTQLDNYGNQMNQKELDRKSTINLSDFENDTSSPFDNMELKSINDLEELAQVLNQEENDQKCKTKTPFYVQDNPHSIQIDQKQSSQLSFNDYLPSGYSGSQYLCTIPSILTSVMPHNENFVHSNGYKYPTDFTNINQEYNPYTWTKFNRDCQSFQLEDADSKKSNFKSVPDLVNALEIEFNNCHLSDLSKSNTSDKTNLQESRAKSVDEVSTFHQIPQHEESSLKLLSKDEQNICKAISIMGFPLERVARAYKLVGNDEKKVSTLSDNFLIFQWCNKYVESIKNNNNNNNTITN